MFTDKEHRILLSAMGREFEVCKQVDKEVCREPYEERLESVCKSINRKIRDIQHKYQWHDLRKDPSDLPKDTSTKIVYVIAYGVKCYLVAQYFANFKENHKWQIDAMDVEDALIIAWREIEPFSEVK